MMLNFFSCTYWLFFISVSSLRKCLFSFLDYFLIKLSFYYWVVRILYIFYIQIIYMISKCFLLQHALLQCDFYIPLSIWADVFWLMSGRSDSKQLLSLYLRRSSDYAFKFRKASWNLTAMLWKSPIAMQRGPHEAFWPTPWTELLLKVSISCQPWG